jgi:hypothetical protein
MNRRALLACASLAVLLVSSTIELGACGDKFLRIGRSMRHRTYAAVHRASILVYVPADMKPGDAKAFEKALKRAGHRPTSVRGMDELVAALGENKYDLLIATLADAPRVKGPAASSASQPQVLPVVAKRANSTLAEIEREYAFTLKVDAPSFNALATIDDVMKARLARARSAATAAN